MTTLTKGLVLGFLFFSCGRACSRFSGENSILSEEQSPSRTKRATRFQSDGGATTGVITCVNIQDAAETFNPRKGLAVGIKGRESSSILWSGDHKLIIILPRTANIYLRRDAVAGVTIEYQML